MSSDNPARGADAAMTKLEAEEAYRAEVRARLAAAKSEVAGQASGNEPHGHSNVSPVGQHRRFTKAVNLLATYGAVGSIVAGVVLLVMDSQQIGLFFYVAAAALLFLAIGGVNTWWGEVVGKWFRRS